MKVSVANTLTATSAAGQYAFVQKKMGYYPLAGLAHKAIFVGFMVRMVLLGG